MLQSVKRLEKLGSSHRIKPLSVVIINLGPVVQSIVSLTSSLVVKMLTSLVISISNSQVFLLKKCE